MIDGKVLLSMGYEPGKWFKKAIDHANEFNLKGEDLRTYLDTVRPQYIKPYEAPKPYFSNIRAEGKTEIDNIAKVHQSMDELMRTPTLVTGAVMPDACPTGSVGTIPVGGIAVAQNAIHPAMHSADICCSVMASSFGMIDPRKVLDQAHKVTHFGPGGRRDPFPLPKSLALKMEANKYLRDDGIMHVAEAHLGTQGDGNHFLFVGQSGNTGETFMVTHHGSRGVGAKLYKKGMQLAERFRKELSPKSNPKNAWIPFDTQEGQDYWEALQIIREWTRLNHELLHNASLDGLGLEKGFRFWNEHNFVFKKDDLFYHAKGATPLDDVFVPDSTDGLRLIPLNMAEPVLVVKGKTTDKNLGFAPHGAGRNISRSQHKRNQGERSIQEIFDEETKGLDIRFYSKNVDISELPSAYKNANAVKEQMKEFDLGEIVDEIIPYGCIMAGDWQKDAPWKKKARKRIKLSKKS